MEQKQESATSHVKSTELNSSTDTNSVKEHTSSMISPPPNVPLPNVVVLVLLMLCVGVIIIAGYLHGDMHFAKVLEHLKS